MHLYLAQTAITQPLTPLDPNNPQAKWATLEEALELLSHPKDKEFLKNNQNKIKHCRNSNTR